MLEVRMGAGERDAFGRILGILNQLDVQETWPLAVNEVIHPAFLQASRENIEGQGRLAGESWNYSTEPLYEAWKKKKGLSPYVMRWQPGTKERLFPSLTDPNHLFHYFRMTRNSASIGTLVSHARDLTVGGVNDITGETYPGRTLLAMGGSKKKKVTTDIQRVIHNNIDIRGRRHSL